MKFNLSKIMKKAWSIFRKEVGLAFREALKRAWASAKAEPINALRIENAKKAAGITEETNTWYCWKTEGFEVVHGSKCLFQVELIHASKGPGKTYKASFFAVSQVRRVMA